MKRYSSLRRKLMALIAGGGIVSALIAAAGFSWLDVNRFWQNTNAQVVAIASIVADQVEPAIALGDRKAAAEILSSLRADPTIRDAVLYDPRGACFARANERSAPCPALPPDGLHRQHGAVFLARSIRADGERQGTLVHLGQRSFHDGGAAPVPRRRRPDHRAQPGGGGDSRRGAASPCVGAHSGDCPGGGAHLPDAPVPGPRGR